MAIAIIFPAVTMAFAAVSLLSIWRNRAPEPLRTARTLYAVAGSLAVVIAALAVIYFALPLFPAGHGNLSPLPCHDGKYYRC